MAMRFLTAGESHGKALVVIVEGLPARMPLTAEDINADLARRQQGYGRGGRMEIERDQVEILSGVRLGETLGSPAALLIRNRDWENWQDRMSVEPGEKRPEAATTPRPGHADLAGALKYGFGDVRNVLERASARETAARVAAGATARRLLSEFGVRVASHVVAVGEVEAGVSAGRTTVAEMEARAEGSPLRCVDRQAEQAMMRAIDRARDVGDTLGGVFEVVAEGLPVGLGSYAHWDRRLDGRLAQAVMSIPAIKGVEIGLGFAGAGLPGSQVQDEILVGESAVGWSRASNRAGGLEGGVTNGQPVVVRAAMKPLSTLGRPLRTVDIATGQEATALRERSDVCAVPAGGVVAEAMVCWVLAEALLEKFGGDCLPDMQSAYQAYLARLGR
jgi:chorismate synthase